MGVVAHIGQRIGAVTLAGVTERTAGPADPSPGRSGPDDDAPRRTSWRAAPGLAARGALVGAAEAVPGISGGTVALVVGLYDDLIHAAGRVVHAARQAVAGVLGRTGLGPAGRTLRGVDWPLLVPVLTAMAVVALLALRTIAPLLEQHPVPMRALFFGIIAVSVAVPLRLMPERVRVRDGVLLVAGAVAGFVLTGLPPATVDEPSLWYVFLGAAIAINALVLPGVSGSFVLVALGLYVHVERALDARDLAFVATFLVGATLGLASFVRLLQWLLDHRRQATMAVLGGLMAGSLRALWPWQDDDRTLLAPEGSVAGPLALAVVGAAVVVVALVLQARRTASAAPAGPAGS